MKQSKYCVVVQRVAPIASTCNSMEESECGAGVVPPPY